MDVFGDHWLDHHLKIRKDWMEQVKEEDVVLLPGDTSWALKMEDALEDLHFLENLPGIKILVRGNHDYWWTGPSKLKGLGLKNIVFIQNDSFDHEGISYCGSRGWILPEDGSLSLEDQKIYDRELQRLELSLASAKEQRKIVLLHYPPFSRDGLDSTFVELMKRHQVEVCVYGHLHNHFEHRAFLEGMRHGISFKLVSCDYLDFKLTKIL